MQGLGAYFGSTKIIQGVGQDGPLQAYADGVVGGGAMDAEMPGPLFAYSDGSLGDDAPSDGPTAISVFNDGILGEHFVVSADMPGPLQSYHDGSLGADAALPVLDLGDPTTLAEVKMLLAYSSGGWALSDDGQKTYTSDFYTSGIWEPSASVLWQYVLSATAAFSGKDVSDSSGSQTFPNGSAIAYLYAMLAAPTGGAMGPDAAAKMFPTITAWFTGKGTSTMPPYLSIADKTSGTRAVATAGMQMSSVAMWGLGAAALLGLALVLRKK